MVQFHVPDMTCGAFANRIGRALHQAGLPSNQQVDIDVGNRQLRLARVADAKIEEAVRNAIESAGYTVEKIVDGPESSSVQRSGGCCCASRKTTHVDANQSSRTQPTGCCG